jgi:hypothetical protein
MELQCSCRTAERFETIAKALVNEGIAEVLEETFKNDTDGKVRERVCKYEVAIGDWGETTVYVRWWENKELDRASIQMSHEALDALLESTTVMARMMQLGQKISKNGHGVSSEDLKKTLKNIIKQLSGEEEEIEVVP